MFLKQLNKSGTEFMFAWSLGFRDEFTGLAFEEEVIKDGENIVWMNDDKLSKSGEGQSFDTNGMPFVLMVL